MSEVFFTLCGRFPSDLHPVPWGQSIPQLYYKWGHAGDPTVSHVTHTHVQWSPGLTDLLHLVSEGVLHRMEHIIDSNLSTCRPSILLIPLKPQTTSSIPRSFLPPPAPHVASSNLLTPLFLIVSYMFCVPQSYISSGSFYMWPPSVLHLCDSGARGVGGALVLSL